MPIHVYVCLCTASVHVVGMSEVKIGLTFEKLCQFVCVYVR